MEIRRKKKQNMDITLSEGIVMTHPLKMETSSWLKNCMVKSLLVFSVIFGSLGCLLSSLDLEYYVLPTAVILFLVALLFTTIYYRGWIMDVVYVVFLVIFFFLVRSLQPYINGGYYLIVNRVFEIVEDYFELPGMQYYEIAVNNDPLAVTVVTMFVGTVMMIVANVIISRTMNVWFLLCMTGLFWIFPMYFRLEPDACYAILMLTGYLAVWSIHSSGAYGMDRKHRDYKWKDKKGRKLRIWYVQDAATMLEVIGGFLVCIFLIYGLTAWFGGKGSFNQRYTQNPYKEQSEDDIQKLVTGGFSAFNRYDAVGGINGGQLGGVGSVRPDYLTDLVVTFAPYSYEPVYLRAFIGSNYVSEESMWLTAGTEVSAEEAEDLEIILQPDADAQLLETSWSSQGTGAWARMLIRNQGANQDYPYTPYYTKAETENLFVNMLAPETEYLFDSEMDNRNLRICNGYVVSGGIPINQTAEYIYYPYVVECTDGVSEDVQKQAEELYMGIPDACLDAVAKASEEAGITKEDTQEEIVEKVKDYFEEDFLYTTRPGKTPEDKDYVTWFLEKKKGYCAHFATAAVLIYRYNGIPARYAEGYVITYEDIMSGELNEDYAYEDFYRGYSPLGETGVIEVEVTDARAHAWVEVFDASFGWIQEEVTTAAIDPEEEAESFWDVFGSGGGLSEDENITGDIRFQVVDWNLDNIQGIFAAFLIVLGLLGAGFFVRRLYQYRREYQTWHTADANENLLAYYSCISKSIRKRDSQYARCPTYRSQLMYLEGCCEDWIWDTEDIIQKLEYACYSREGLSEETCADMMAVLSELKKKVKICRHV